MGVNLSKNQYKSIYDQATNMMTQVINEYTTKVNTTAYNNQQINVVNGVTGVMDCGASGLVLSNDAKNTITALYSLTNTTNSTAYNTLVDKLTNSITNAVNQTNSGIPLGQFNANINSTDVQTKIKTTITNQLKNTVNQIFNTTSIGIQGINFTNYGKVTGAKCTFSNTSVTSMFVQMLLNNTAQNLVQNYSDVASTNTDNTTTTQSNDMSLGSLLGFGKFGGVLLILGILAVVGGIGAMIIKKKNK